MKINRNNYEIFFLDYFEGRLSPEQVIELMAFLELHYDLKEEFGNFENVSLPPEKNIVFDAKESLKKPSVTAVGLINEKNYEECFIGKIEGELSKEQDDQLSAFLEKNPHLKKELDLFSRTKITPDHSIKFPDKESLKRKSSVFTVGEINENNYPEYFIAAAEGDLNKEQLQQIDQFLAKNPSLKKEYELFSKIKIEPDQSVIFDQKENLKKNIIVPAGSVNESNYAEYFIAAMEGDLALPKLTDLKEFLAKNPHLHKEFNLFGQTKLAVDTAIVFNRKHQLKQQERTAKIFSIKNIYYPVSIAASVILIIAIYQLFSKSGMDKVNFAGRSNINIHRTIENNASQNVMENNSANEQNFANVQPVQKKDIKDNNNNQRNSEFRDFQYASVIPSSLESKDPAVLNTELKEVTFYRDFFAMVQKKRNTEQEQKQDNNRFLSLKDFALFKLKRSITPEDKKDKITPNDSRISLWDLADAGVNKFNNLTGANTHLKHDDQTGGFALAIGDKFEISKN